MEGGEKQSEVTVREGENGNERKEREKWRKVNSEGRYGRGGREERAGAGDGKGRGEGRELMGCR